MFNTGKKFISINVNFIMTATISNIYSRMSGKQVQCAALM